MLLFNGTTIPNYLQQILDKYSLKNLFKTLLIKFYKKIGYQVVPVIKLNYKVNLKIKKSMCSFYNIVHNSCRASKVIPPPPQLDLFNNMDL